MRRHEFDTHDEYVEEQKKLTRRKMANNKTRCFTLRAVVEAIRLEHPAPVHQGLCHGVRLGGELTLFEELFEHGTWVGTEITEELCDGQRILHRDFTQIDAEWVGRFDLIYSNSFDHSRDPYKTIKTWLACLSPAGRLYIEWTDWHNRLGGPSSKADCYAASDDEYFELFHTAGRVERIFPVFSEGVLRKIFVLR